MASIGPMPALDTAAGEATRRRLAWRSRRGMKELDLLLTAWLRDGWPTASPADRAAFAALLELPDPDLQRYLLAGDRPADPDLQRLVAAIGNVRAAFSLQE